MLRSRLHCVDHHELDHSAALDVRAEERAFRQLYDGLMKTVDATVNEPGALTHKHGVPDERRCRTHRGVELSPLR